MAVDSAVIARLCIFRLSNWSNVTTSMVECNCGEAFRIEPTTTGPFNDGSQQRTNIVHVHCSKKFRELNLSQSSSDENSLDQELQVEPPGSREDIRPVGAATYCTSTIQYFVVASF